MAKLSENFRGALLMMGAMCAYTINDALMKGATTDVPLFQAILLRGVGAIIGLSIFGKMMGHLRFDLPRRDWVFVVLRTLCEVGGTYFFLTALMHMPIANISAIMQALPLTVALAAAVFLREALGWRRLTAILVGFLGVMFIIRPGGADFNSYSIYALVTVVCITMRDIAVRRISSDVPAVFVALIAAIGVALLGAVGTLFIDMKQPGLLAGVQITGATLFLMVGYILSVTAMRSGEIGFVAPFRYTSLLVALAIGVVFFDEWPDLWTVIGASIVVVTGLFTLYREGQLRARQNAVTGRFT